MPPAGIEPTSQDPESYSLSVSLQGLSITLNAAATFDEAEGTGFEPVEGLLPRVFETRAIGHYANPPRQF